MAQAGFFFGNIQFFKIVDEFLLVPVFIDDFPLE